MALSEPTLPVVRVVYVGAAAIYFVLALVYVTAPLAEPHLAFAAVFAVVGTFLGVLAFAISYVPARWVELLVLLSIVVAEAGALSFLALTGDPKQSVVVLIVVVAAGVVAPSVRTALCGAAFGVLGWLVLADGFSNAELAHWGINVGGAAVVSVAISAARLRAETDLKLARFTIDRATDAIYLIAPDGRFSYVNEAACRLLGYTREEMLRMRVHDINPVLSDEIWQAHWQNLSEQRALVVQTFHRTRDGRLIPVEVSLNLASFDGRELNVAIARDVTERRKVSAELKRAKQAAEAASQAKSNFLATMSHEIRTPLNGVFGMTELALDAGDPAEQREFIMRARASAETLLLLLDDILDTSRMEFGQLQLEKIDFDPRDLMRDLESALSFTAARRGIELRLHCDDDVPARVHGDPRRLRQILLNLTANALKFTERGAVEVRLEAGTCDEHRFELLGVVRDTGIGIPADKLESIFEPFTQVDGSDTRAYGGAGLGLAIVRQLLALMNGTVEVESEPGVGSTFRFRVPLQIVSASTSTSLTH
ncbi:MAG TPA: ATP-binding protein [Candidatus Binatia bacterium]